MTRRVAVSIRPTPCGLGTIVKCYGIEVAFIQGDYDDLNKSKLRNYIREAFGYYRKEDVVDCFIYAGIMRFNHDDFARR